MPLKKGRCGTYTHDYKRNGTTTLFAALDVLQGKAIGQCQARHRHQEWLKFLRRLDREYPDTLKLHLVMDNYGTHKTPEVKAWLQKHPRFVWTATVGEIVGKLARARAQLEAANPVVPSPEHEKRRKNQRSSYLWDTTLFENEDEDRSLRSLRTIQFLDLFCSSR